MSEANSIYLIVDNWVMVPMNINGGRFLAQTELWDFVEVWRCFAPATCAVGGVTHSGLPIFESPPQARTSPRKLVAVIGFKDAERRPLCAVVHLLDRLGDRIGQGRGCAPGRGMRRRRVSLVDEAAPMR